MATITNNADGIEWTGIGTVATGLRAHDVGHNNYKINIDWNTQCFDIIVTEDFNYLSGITNINIVYLDEIIIGSNIYNLTLYVNNNNINITIYGPMDETPNYDIERNYPYTIRFTKEGVYVLYESTSHLIMERDYDLDTIYFNEDGLDNEPLSGSENGDYDVAFDLAVSEYSEQTEEPETPSGIIARYTASASGVLPTFNEGYQYTVDETVSNGIYTVELYSDTDFTSCSFNEKINLLTVEYLRVTNNVTDMSYMFQNCTNLTSLDVSNWNTSKVQNMGAMFGSCYGLSELKTDNWDTSNVTNTSWMFNRNFNLKSLDLSSWNTSKITNMTWMFTDCTGLETLNLNGWNIKNAEYSNMFIPYEYTGCPNLTSILMNNSDYNSVNGIIEQLPTRTSDSVGTLDIEGVDDISQVNTTTAESKFWNVSNQYKIAEYKFDNTIYDYFPEFNEGFNYTYEETVNGNITARSIYSDSLPSAFMFGYDQGATEWTNSLLEVNYLDATNVANMYATFAFCQNLTYVNVNNVNNVTNMYGMFNGCTNVTSINTTDWDTSKVTDMGAMFYNCESLTSLDVSNWDTGEVTTMHLMFHGCNKVPVLNITSWNTSRVTIMADMFAYCTNLTTLDLSNFNTSNVTDMYGMFNNCTSLTTLTGLDQWNTSKVTSMNCMFQYCTNLTSLDVNGFDTSKVTDMCDMFYECSNLTSLDVSNWNTSNVTNMQYMFYNCNKLTSLNIPNMKFDKLTTITNFLQNSGIKQLNFSRNTLPEISMADFMNDATSLNVIKCENKNNIAKVISHLPVRTVENPGKIITQVPISQFTELEIQALADKNWAISNEELVVVAKYKFAKDIYGSMIPVFNEEFTNYFVDDEYLDTEDLTGMYKSLPNKSNGESGEADYTITADNIVTRTISVLVDDVKPYNIRFGSHVVNVSSTTKDRHKSGSIIEILDLNISTNYDAELMFNGCVNMINCNINGLNTDAASSMYGMFADCCKLTTLDIDHLNIIKVQDFEAMFSNCESLTSLDVSNFNTGKATYMSYMFYNCNNLTTLDVSNFDTSNVTNMQYMFYNCYNLTSLDVSSFDTSKVTDMNSMFCDCTNLTTLDVSNFDTSKVIDMYQMFSGCSNLTTLDLSNFDTSKVTDMCDMCFECHSLESLDLSNWNTSSVTDMCGMFDSCESLRSINVRNWDTSNVTDMSWLFEQCYSLKTIIGLDTWDVSNVTDMTGIFVEDEELTTLNISNWSLNSELYTSDFMFDHNYRLDTIIMNNSDSDSVNRIISELPTRTSDSMGTLNILGIDDISQVDIATAESKYWIVMADPTNIRHMHLGDMVISNLYIGEVEIKKVCLGEIIIYENKQVATDKDTLYNEFTGALFILKEDALSYDENELNLVVDSDVVEVNYDNENLNIGGDSE